ncbi:hypothetical protein C8F01DRAFT_1075713 [Mycena amicta]|nr:hypothetical protein C8F01DRAFT_1075713 [Mycena amicta]
MCLGSNSGICFPRKQKLRHSENAVTCLSCQPAPEPWTRIKALKVQIPCGMNGLRRGWDRDGTETSNGPGLLRGRNIVPPPHEMRLTPRSFVQKVETLPSYLKSLKLHLESSPSTLILKPAPNGPQRALRVVVVVVALNPLKHLSPKPTSSSSLNRPQRFQPQDSNSPQAAAVLNSLKHRQLELALKVFLEKPFGMPPLWFIASQPFPSSLPSSALKSLQSPQSSTLQASPLHHNQSVVVGAPFSVPASNSSSALDASRCRQNLDPASRRSAKTSLDAFSPRISFKTHSSQRFKTLARVQIHTFIFNAIDFFSTL